MAVYLATQLNPVAIPMAGLAITSAGYHCFRGEKGKKWGRWDVRFMYATFNSIIAYLAYQLSGQWEPALVMAISLTGWMWYNEQYYKSTYVSAWQFAIGSMLAFMVVGHAWFIPAFAIGYVFNIPFLNHFDKTKNWSKKKVDWMHGVWHLFTATGYILMFIQ